MVSVATCSGAPAQTNVPDPLAGWVELEELSVEHELRAVGRALDQPPGAAHAKVGFALCGLEMPRSHPAADVLGLRDGAVHEVRWRLEEPADVDDGLPWWSRDLSRHVRHSHVASPFVVVCVSWCRSGCPVSDLPAAHRAVRRGARSSPPKFAVRADPIRQLLEPHRLEVAEALTGLPASRNQSGLLEHVEVLVMAGWLIGNGAATSRTRRRPGRAGPGSPAGCGSDSALKARSSSRSVRSAVSVRGITIWLYQVPRLSTLRRGHCPTRSGCGSCLHVPVASRARGAR